MWYIRLDSKNRIIHGFSDVFEAPTAGDVCVNDSADAGRQFMLNEEYNPPLLDARGYPLYKYDATAKAITSTTDADLSDLIQATAVAAAAAPLTDNQRIDLIQAAIDSLLMGGTTNG